MDGRSRCRPFPGRDGTRPSRWISKGPTALIANRIDDRHADHFFETFQFSKDDRATRPGAREGDVKMITTSDRRVRCRSIGRDPFAKRVFLPLKLAGVRLLGWKLWLHLSLSHIQMNCASRISVLDLLGASVALL